jgi:hypothetical protein
MWSVNATWTKRRKETGRRERVAIMVARISVVDLEEELMLPSGKVRSGKAGASAYVQITTPEERAAIGHNAAAVRWSTAG